MKKRKINWFQRNIIRPELVFSGHTEKGYLEVFKIGVSENTFLSAYVDGAFFYGDNEDCLSRFLSEVVYDTTLYEIEHEHLPLICYEIIKEEDLNGKADFKVNINFKENFGVIESRNIRWGLNSQRDCNLAIQQYEENLASKVVTESVVETICSEDLKRNQE